MSSIEPFRIAVPDSDLEDLRLRLREARWPDQLPDSGWDYGADYEYLRPLAQYWADTYDWRVHEAALNRFPGFLTEIDGQRIHFLHVRSPHADALPLVLTHGWPGSVAEFLDVIDPLIDPEAHGGSATDAFHVVAPSIPGYGFSGPTTQTGWGIRRVAEALTTLMAELGYDRYGAQGGDWGAIATMNIGAIDPEHVVGIHLNMIIATPPNPENPLEGVEEHEMGALGDMGNFMANETGYQQIQGTKPQTLGYGLTDSPAGLAGWILEKFRTWSDCDGDVESVFTKDQLLTNIALYWVTNTISSSTRLYYETMKAGQFGALPSKVTVPTGVAVFPKEIYRPPLAWAKETFNITHWNHFEKGGHFAAMEQPDAFVGDVRAFFRTVR